MWAASTKPKKKGKTKETKKKEEQQREIKNQERTRGRKETETKIKNVYPRREDALLQDAQQTVPKCACHTVKMDVDPQAWEEYLYGKKQGTG
jgi:hypothetical protein